MSVGGPVPKVAEAQIAGRGQRMRQDKREEKIEGESRKGEGSSLYFGRVLGAFNAEVEEFLVMVVLPWPRSAAAYRQGHTVCFHSDTPAKRCSFGSTKSSFISLMKCSYRECL